MSKELLRLEPVFQEKIWGGDRLRTVFHYDIPSDHTGECWAISGHPSGDCHVKNPGRPWALFGKKGRTCLATCRGTASLCW